MGLIGGPVPDFKTAHRPHQADFPGKPGIVTQIGRDQDTALTVQGAVLHPGDEEALEVAKIPTEQGLLRQFAFDLLPLLQGNGQKITDMIRGILLEPLLVIGEDELAFLAFLQDFPLTGRDADSPFAIHEMEMRAPEHRAITPHYLPLYSTWRQNTAFRRELSRKKMGQNQKNSPGGR